MLIQSDLGPSVTLWMRPVRAPAPVSLATEAARRLVAREGLSFLVVVASAPPRIVGVVSRASLARRPCCDRANGRCAVATHLAAEGGFCFADEPLDDVLAAEEEWMAEIPRALPRSLPLIVVDRDLAPLGFLPQRHASEARIEHSCAA